MMSGQQKPIFALDTEMAPAQEKRGRKRKLDDPIALPPHPGRWACLRVCLLVSRWRIAQVKTHYRRAEIKCFLRPLPRIELLLDVVESVQVWIGCSGESNENELNYLRCLRNCRKLVQVELIVFGRQSEPLLSFVGSLIRDPFTPKSVRNLSILDPGCYSTASLIALELLAVKHVFADEMPPLDFRTQLECLIFTTSVPFRLVDKKRLFDLCGGEQRIKHLRVFFDTPLSDGGTMNWMLSLQVSHLALCGPYSQHHANLVKDARCPALETLIIQLNAERPHPFLRCVEAFADDARYPRLQMIEELFHGSATHLLPGCFDHNNASAWTENWIKHSGYTDEERMLFLEYKRRNGRAEIRIHVEARNAMRAYGLAALRANRAHKFRESIVQPDMFKEILDFADLDNVARAKIAHVAIATRKLGDEVIVDRLDPGANSVMLRARMGFKFSRVADWSWFGAFLNTRYAQNVVNTAV